MSSLGELEAQILAEALDDEYRAWATYDQVIRDFGNVRPFVNIRAAEARHIEALIELFERYGLTAFQNSWPGRVPRYATVTEACAAAVAGEAENGRLYERLLTGATHLDIRNTLRHLMEASQQRHLPAFERCAERSGRHVLR